MKSVCILILFTSSLITTAVFGSTNEPIQPGVTEHLGWSVRGELFPFRDETGAPVVLADFMHPGRPVILTPVYFQCPALCNMMLNGMIASLKQIKGRVGQDFDVISFSINPTEGPALAQAKKTSYLHLYGRPMAAEGWHFLTGDEAQIRALTDQIGFMYTYDPTVQQYNHPAALVILTPQGQISSYLYGATFSPENMQKALLAAGLGQHVSIGEKVLVFCERFNPLSLATRTHRSFTVRWPAYLFAGLFLLFLFLKKLKKS